MGLGLDISLLLGNLTQDPQLRYTQAGSAVCNFDIAVNREWPTKDGNKRTEVCYIPIVVWGKQAEQCGEYLQKGDPVMVVGNHHQQSWDDASGKRRTKVEISANRVVFIKLKKDQQPTANREKHETPTDDVPF